MITVTYANLVVIDPIVTSKTWSGDITLPYRTLTVTLSNTIDGETQAIPIELGKELRIYDGDTELFRGVAFQKDINEAGAMTVTAYDENVYLLKNTDTRKFVGLTASSILKKLCADYGITVGTIADTGYVIPKLILRNMTLWDMIVTALTETRKQNNRRFVCYTRAGRLYLAERKDRKTTWLLEGGTNILTASYSQSIEELRNQVKVTGGDEDKAPIVATVKNAALIKKYGTMQHLEIADSTLNKSQIEQLAKQLLADLAKITDDAQIEALGNVEVVAGSSIYAVESMTGITGAFYVSTDAHTFDAAGSHTMAVTLSATDDLPKLEYDDPTPPTTAKKTTAKKKPKKKSGPDQASLDELNAFIKKYE